MLLFNFNNYSNMCIFPLPGGRINESCYVYNLLASSASVTYLAFVQVMLTAGIILSLVVYNCHYRKTKRNSVPNYLKTVSRT